MDDGDHDIDELFDELTGDGDGPAPTWRATIRGRRLTLTGWAPWLIREGPVATLLPGREADGISIADLTIHGTDDDEVSVRFYALGAEQAVVESVLIRWAELVGHRRLWLPDRLVSLEPDPDSIGTASVRCPTCRARWQDSSPNFWLNVKRAHTFPRWCPLCGCEMPQWSVRRGRSAGSAGASKEGWRAARGGSLTARARRETPEA